MIIHKEEELAGLTDSEPPQSNSPKPTNEPNLLTNSSGEQCVIPRRALSRSPPRSRRRTESSDSRRRSVEREIEIRQDEDKKKMRNLRNRQRGESIRRLSIPLACDAGSDGSKPIEAGTGNNRDSDDLEGIYSLKEVNRMFSS